MSGKKGMKKYPVGIREEVVSRIQAGKSQRALCRKYGISWWAIQCWLKEPVLPKTPGRKPAKTLAEYKYENKRLKYDFVHRLGRPEKDAALAEVIAEQQERSFRMYGHHRM